MSFFGRRFRHGRKWRRRGRRACKHRRWMTLADIPPGRRMRVMGFLPGLPAGRRAHMQAYGLVVGRLVQVLQHRPVTVVQIDHTELALEDDLADKVQVAEE